MSKREVSRWVMRLIDFGKGADDPELEGMAIGEVADRIIEQAREEE